MQAVFAPSDMTAPLLDGAQGNLQIPRPWIGGHIAIADSGHVVEGGRRGLSGRGGDLLGHDAVRRVCFG